MDFWATARFLPRNPAFLRRRQLEARGEECAFSAPSREDNQWFGCQRPILRSGCDRAGESHCMHLTRATARTRRRVRLAANTPSYELQQPPTSNRRSREGAGSFAASGYFYQPRQLQARKLGIVGKSSQRSGHPAGLALPSARRLKRTGHLACSRALHSEHLKHQ